MRKMKFIPCLLVAIIPFLLTGCKKSTDNWEAPEIETWLDKHWGLNGIELEEKEDGTFFGTGTILNGEAIRFTVEKMLYKNKIHFRQVDEEGATIRSTIFEVF